MNHPRSKRETSTMAALAFLVVEGFLAHWQMGVSDEVLLAAIALVGGHVAGATYRPTGSASASTSTTVIQPPPQATP